MVIGMQRNGLWRHLLTVWVVALLLCVGKTARAERYADVIDGSYSECGIKKLGDYALQVDFTVQFKPAAGNMAGDFFGTRGVAMFAYDATGKRTRLGASDLFYYPSMNGTSSGRVVDRPDYSFTFADDWQISGAFTAKIRVTLRPSAFQKWPAIGVAPVNITNNGWLPVFPKIGAFYIGPDMLGCQIIDPEKPPPSPATTEITVVAPNWDLGELERGKETTRIIPEARALCFMYDPKYIEHDKYLINAGNRHGVAANKFLLANTADDGDTIPYMLILVGSGRSTALPNINGQPLTLGNSGRTCLTPVFKAWAGSSIKGGDYSDVLTFTITTTP